MQWLTIGAVRRVDDAWRDAQNKDTLFAILGAELGNDHVEGRLGDAVGYAHPEIILPGELGIG